MRPLSGNVQVDFALTPTSYAGATAATSPYFNMKNYEKVIFICSAGTMTSSGNVAMRLLSAPTSTAPAAAITIGTVTTINGTPSDATTITKAIAVQMPGSSEILAGLDGVTMTINNVTYTFQTSSGGTATPATSDFAATRLVCASSAEAAGNVVAPYATLNHLAAYINHATYGVPGLTATVSAASSYMTITQSEPGDAAITIVLSATPPTVFPTEMIGYLEADGKEFNASSSQDHVAIEVTPSTNQKLSIVALRYGGRYSVDRGYMVSAWDDVV